MATDNWESLSHHREENMANDDDDVDYNDNDDGDEHA